MEGPTPAASRAKWEREKAGVKGEVICKGCVVLLLPWLHVFLSLVQDSTHALTLVRVCACVRMRVLIYVCVCVPVGAVCGLKR